MKKYWFKSKRLGYGFCPICLEGWLIILALLGLVFLSAWINNIWSKSIDGKNGFRFFLDTLILLCVFTALYKDKVIGGLRWRF